MFGPFIESFDWLRSHRPEIFKKRRLSFLSIHYIYIIGMSIVGSIFLFPHGNIHYIDALFFATGSATQSGLNPIDVNKLNTYQQIVLYLFPMFCTPIFIHSAVVFVRLYWFEKRFQHVVREARSYRRTLSRSKTTDSERNNPGQVERGVNGRHITVMHNDPKEVAENQAAIDMIKKEKETDESSSPEVSKSSDKPSEDSDRPEKSPTPPVQTPVGLHHRDITFADEVKPEPRVESEDQLSTLPEQRTAEQHIAFLQRQRDANRTGTLRIPGPRESDRGDVPEDLDLENDGGAVGRRQTGAGEPDTPTAANMHKRRLSSFNEPSRPSGDDSRFKRHLTIEEPVSPRATRKIPFPSMRIRKPSALGRTPTTASKASGTEPHISRRSATFSTIKRTLTGASNTNEVMPYLSWTPTIGRNSAFVDLTAEQREELGGIEYRALKTLANMLIVYYLGFHIFGIIAFVPWIRESVKYGGVVSADAISRTWWGFFTPASMLNDVGFTLTPDSMISFQMAIFPLLLGSFLIVIGNTGFPCMLRFILWITSKVLPHGSATWEELIFLLDHPRRCFTLLFPSKATWWLFWILAGLNSVDLLFFVILDLNDPTVTVLAPGYRVLNGWFQATSTRTAGFSCVNLELLHPAIQVSYLVMMYISVFPIAISVRRTNVYEEKSLGIYGSKSAQAEDDAEPSYVGAHLRKQLSFDLWYVFLGLFVITIAEASRIQNIEDVYFTTFNVLFEIVSAYGTVGLSLGYPGINASFSAEFTTVSKVVIILMMLRGRHRGLPYELDRAILLPSESLHRKEDEDANTRMMQRRNSNLSTLEASGVGRSGGHATGMQHPFTHQHPHPHPGVGSPGPLDPQGAAAEKSPLSAAGRPLGAAVVDEPRDELKGEKSQ